jgi:hypothetical protein
MTTSLTVPTLEAQIEDLVNRDILIKYEPSPSAGMLQRMLYCSEHMFDALEKLPTTMPPPLPDGLRLGGDTLSFSAQAYDRIEEFATSPKLEPHRFKRLNPLENGVYELKTAHLRLFGAFAGAACFVFASLGIADDLKDRPERPATDTYGAHIRKTLAFFETVRLPVFVGK